MISQNGGISGAMRGAAAGISSFLGFGAKTYFTVAPREAARVMTAVHRGIREYLTRSPAASAKKFGLDSKAA